MSVVEPGKVTHSDLTNLASDVPGTDADAKAFESLEPGVPRSTISDMPDGILAKILLDLPPEHLRNVAATDSRLREVVTKHPQLATVYGQVQTAGRTARRLQENDQAASMDELFDRAMSAQKVASQLKSDGALDPADSVFDLALLQLKPHVPNLPRPEDIPTGLPDYVTRPITSSDIDAIEQRVVDGSGVDAAVRLRNLDVLRLFNSRHQIVPKAIEANQGRAKLYLSRDVKRPRAPRTVANWVEQVRPLDERSRRYAMQLAPDDVRAKLTRDGDD